MKSDKSSVNWRTLKLFWKFTRPNPWLFSYGTVGAIFGVLTTDIFPPLIVASAFNHIQQTLSQSQTLSLDSLMVYVYLYVASMLATVFIWRTQAWCVWKYSILGTQRIYEYLFNHLQHMGSKFHADRFGGALVSQVNKFASAYDRTVSDFTWNVLTGVTAIVASVIVLLITNALYAIAFIVLASIYFAVVFRQMRKQAPYNRDLSSSESELTAKLADNITNVATVRAFAGERYELRLFKKQTNSTTNTHFRLMGVQMKNELISQAGTSILDVAAFVLGLVAIAKFKAPVGSLYLIVTYTISLTNRLWQSMFVVRNINRSFGDAAEMTEILDLEPEIKDPENPKRIVIQNGSIQLNSVGFSYEDSGKKTLVFNNLNLQIEGGEKIGLVGHSGGGKTTITKLLLRFSDIQEGQILIDGFDIANSTQEDLRSHIAYVPQEPLLFHRSLAENIRYGKLKASAKEVKAASKMAHADEFIKGLSKGYETLVGERGIKLSGGQKQRVAIARAMLKDAPILILDEATSALDSESELLIQDALWKLMEGRTAIVIAHRLSTIQKMDRIIVLEDGKIVEQGSHKELLDKKGTYAQLWAHQSGGFIEE